MKGPQCYVNHLQAGNCFCSSVPENWMNMSSEFNYFLTSPGRDPFTCQEKPLLSKNITLLSQGPYNQDNCPPNSARLAGYLQRLLFTTWQTCTFHQYVVQCFWKLFSYFLKTWGQIWSPMDWQKKLLFNRPEAGHGEFSGWKDKGQSKMDISESFIFKKQCLGGQIFT